MAEFITFLIALPFLHVIGGFYYRLGAWIYRAWRAGGTSDPSINP
jgi:hypothetical protein